MVIRIYVVSSNETPSMLIEFYKFKKLYLNSFRLNKNETINPAPQSENSPTSFFKVEPMKRSAHRNVPLWVSHGAENTKQHFLCSRKAAKSLKLYEFSP